MAVRVLWVALGGAIGSSCRYLLDGAVYRVLQATFPYGTFVVNVTGCLVFEIVDAPDKIEAFLPELDQMVGEGLVTVERAEVVMYRGPEKPRG